MKISSVILLLVFFALPALSENCSGITDKGSSILGVNVNPYFEYKGISGAKLKKQEEIVDGIVGLFVDRFEGDSRSIKNTSVEYSIYNMNEMGYEFFNTHKQDFPLPFKKISPSIYVSDYFVERKIAPVQGNTGRFIYIFDEDYKDDELKKAIIYSLTDISIEQQELTAVLEKLMRLYKGVESIKQYADLKIYKVVCE